MKTHTVKYTIQSGSISASIQTGLKQFFIKLLLESLCAPNYDKGFGRHSLQWESVMDLTVSIQFPLPR